MRWKTAIRNGVRYALGLTCLLGATMLPATGAKADPGDYSYYQFGDYSYAIMNMPDIDQRRDWANGVFGLPNKGAMYCVPTSCMNLLGYIANHGFPNVMPGPGDWQVNNFGQYNTMSSDLYALGFQMGTDPVAGTTGNGVLFGMGIYLAPSKFAVDNIYASQYYCPLFKDLAIMAIQGRLVDVVVGWYTSPDANSIHVRTGGHVVTLVEAESPQLTRNREALIGIRDPAKDTADLFTQSTFTTTEWSVTDQPGVFAPNFSGVIWPRTQSRMIGYGSGYIAGAIVIKPKVAFTSLDGGLIILSPIALFNAENHAPIKRFPSPNNSNVADIAFDPIAVRSPYLMANQDGVYEIDQITGVSSLLPAVQHDAAGEPLPTKPRQIQIGGPERKLFVLQDTQLSRLSRDGKIETTIPLPQPLLAIRYNQKFDRLFGYAKDGTLYQYTPDLKLVDAARLPQIAQPNSNGVLPKVCMADDPRTGELILMCDGSVRTADGSVFVYDVAFRDGHAGAVTRVILQGAKSPMGLDVDEAGTLFVSDQGLISAYDLQGRKQPRNTFAGMPGGENLHIIRGFTNFDPAVHIGPAYYNVLPENAGLR